MGVILQLIVRACFLKRGIPLKSPNPPSIGDDLILFLGSSLGRLQVSVAHRAIGRESDRVFLGESSS